LNRQGSLGPAPGQRTRGELVLEALDHADAVDAAHALAEIDPRAYRTFNMIVADSRDAFWLNHGSDQIGKPVELHALKDGLSMIAAGALDDPDSPRIRRYRARFLAAAAPDPERGDWRPWEELLTDDSIDPGYGPTSAMKFATDRGFATVSSALIALPSHERPILKSVFRFASHQPTHTPWTNLVP